MPTNALWPTLSAEFSNQILVDVQKTNKKLYRTATEVLAPRMGIRVPTLLEMPKTERHAHWSRILSHPAMEVLSFNIFSAWLIETQTPMLCAWLDALGIEHAPNGCADAFPPSPDAAKLKKGIDVLLEKFDPQIVSIYLRAFNDIDEVKWAALAELIAKDPRLELRAPAVAA